MSIPLLSLARFALCAIVVLVLLGCSATPAEPSTTLAPSDHPCFALTDGERCADYEKALLETAVRVQMVLSAPTPTERHESDGSSATVGGYATVIAGRYLLTHNHYAPIDATAFSDSNVAPYITLSLFDADGRLLLHQRGDRVDLQAVDPQTLLLDFGEVDGVGRLAAAGTRSAICLPEADAFDWTGVVVAQIDWDGETAHVNWTTVREQTTIDSTPVLLLTSCIAGGASGGGVFKDGVHIGNNWKRSLLCQDDDRREPLGSVVALNCGLAGRLDE